MDYQKFITEAKAAVVAAASVRGGGGVKVHGGPAESNSDCFHDRYADIPKTDLSTILSNDIKLPKEKDLERLIQEYMKHKEALLFHWCLLRVFSPDN